MRLGDVRVAGPPESFGSFSPRPLAAARPSTAAQCCRSHRELGLAGDRHSDLVYEESGLWAVPPYLVRGGLRRMSPDPTYKLPE